MDNQKISVFSYLDYRQFLKDKLFEKKREFPKFSNQFFVQKIGLKSRNFLPLVLKGERNISNATVLKIARALNFSKKELEYFETLVQFNQGKTFLEKKHAVEKLKRISIAKLPLRIIPIHHYEFYSKWFHAAIWSLLDIYSFKGRL